VTRDGRHEHRWEKDERRELGRQGETERDAQQGARPERRRSQHAAQHQQDEQGAGDERDVRGCETRMGDQGWQGGDRGTGQEGHPGIRRAAGETPGQHDAPPEEQETREPRLRDMADVVGRAIKNVFRKSGRAVVWGRQPRAAEIRQDGERDP
jgi:hypothetical protein